MAHLTSLFTDPQGYEEALKEMVKNTDFSATAKAIFPINYTAAQSAAKHFPLPKNGKVLDVAAGSGRTKLAISPQCSAWIKSSRT